MTPCVNKGMFTCIGRSGKPKRRFNTDVQAIEAAKKINDGQPTSPTKLVGYKCSQCHGYHLTTHFKRIRK